MKLTHLFGRGLLNDIHPLVLNRVRLIVEDPSVSLTEQYRYVLIYFGLIMAGDRENHCEVTNEQLRLVLKRHSRYLHSRVGAYLDHLHSRKEEQQ
jgi:hypothetical protein